MSKTAYSCLFSLLLAIGLLPGASAQVVISDHPPPQLLDISDQSELFIDSTGSLQIEQVRAMPFKKSHPLEIYTNEGFNNFNIHYWLKFRVRNGLSTDSLSLLFQAGWFDKLELYQIDRIGTRMQASGLLVPYNSRPYPENQYAIPFKVAPGEEDQFFVRISNIYRKTETLLRPRLFNPDFEPYYTARLYKAFSGIYNFTGAFLGAILFMFFFTLFQYFQNRDRVYFFYSAYLLGFFLYFLRRFEIYPDVNLAFSYFSHLFYGLEVSLSMFSYIMYFLFVQHFLNLKENLPRFNWWINKLIIVLVLYLGVDIIISYAWKNVALSSQLYFVSRLFLIPVSLVCILIIYRIKTKLAYFIVAGTSFLLSGAAIAMFSSALFPKYSTYLWDTPITYMQIGVTLELLFFSLGLGYKSFTTQKEKQAAQKKLIAQLEKNERLQRHLNEELEKEVAIRTYEILNKSKELEKNHSERMEAELRQKLAEVELQALQGQMNPHFLFNSLNSIKHFILTNDKFAAADYLTNFSRLVRLILNNSKSKTITLQAELETLQLYMEMEKMRFPQKFEYKINIDKEIVPEEILIPPLILQPYVENAIWHGLMHKKARGLINIHAVKENGRLLCSIQDNGIGREQAMKLNSKSVVKHKSFGMQITKARLDMTDRKSRVQIIDLHNAKGDPLGTKVEIFLPIEPN